MKIIKEQIENEPLKNMDAVIDNKEGIEVHGEMPVDMTGAVVSSRKLKKRTKELLDATDHQVQDKPFLGAKNQPTPDTPVEPKVALEEALFGGDVYDSFEDFKSDIYNALANVVRSYREEEPTVEDVDMAVEWFETHFFDEDGETIIDDIIDESLNEGANKTKEHGTPEQRLADLKAAGLTDRSKEWKELEDDSARSDVLDAWDLIYRELAPNPIDDLSFSMFPSIKRKERYNEEEIAPDYDDNLVIRVKKEDELDFAKKIADGYGLRISEPTYSNVFDDYKVVIFTEDIVDKPALELKRIRKAKREKNEELDDKLQQDNINDQPTTTEPETKPDKVEVEVDTKEKVAKDYNLKDEDIEKIVSRIEEIRNNENK